MNKLRLVWLRLKLALYIGAFFIKLGWLYLSHAIYSIGTIIVILITIVYLCWHTQPFVSIEPVIQTSPPPHVELFTQTVNSPEEIQQQINTTKQLLEKQPQHRDLLVNLALLYRAQGDEKNYQLYWNKARDVDPNNEIFKAEQVL